MALRSSHAVVLAAAVLSAAVLLRPLEAREPAIAVPGKLATVDLGKVFDRLNENADWEMRLTSLQQRIAQEFQTRQAALEARIKELESITGEAESAKAREDLILMRLRFEEWGRLKQVELDREKSLRWQTLYRAVRDEAARLAEAEGYEVVLVNDSLGPLNVSREIEMSQEQQVKLQIEARRLLYAAKATDITEQLVVRMNNARAVRP
jgi:Skp family chaperone for outer membrane proteins